jgi:hypothetical protein
MIWNVPIPFEVPNHRQTKKMKSYLLAPNEAMVEYQPKHDGIFTAGELVFVVGIGRVEFHQLPKGRVIVFNQKHTDCNEAASIMAGRTIYGPVLIADQDQFASGYLF